MKDKPVSPETTPTPCPQCRRPVLDGDPAYAFRGAVYHDWCKDYLREVAAATDAQMREAWKQ